VVGDAGGKLADTAGGVPNDIAQHVGGVTGNAGGRSDGPAANGHPVRSPGADPPAGTPGTGATARSPGGKVHSVEPHEAAPLRRLVAHVWPAIALGPFGELLAALRAGQEGATGPPKPDAPRSPLGLAANTVAAGSAGHSDHSAIADASPTALRGIPLPGGGEIPLIVLLISAAALMALLVVTVRREMGPNL
jgi:hypothetical protein